MLTMNVLGRTGTLLAFFCLCVLKSDAQLGTPPVIAVQPLGISVQNGGTALISATAVSLTSMQFQWYQNGKKYNNGNDVVNVVVPLVGTVSTLTLSGVKSSDAGTYSVVVKNAVGQVTSSNAVMVVLANTVSNVVNIVSSGTHVVPSGFQIQLSGLANSNYVIQASTDLKIWTPISTNSSATGSISYIDTAAKAMPNRYYRVVGP